MFQNASNTKLKVLKDAHVFIYILAESSLHLKIGHCSGSVKKILRTILPFWNERNLDKEQPTVSSKSSMFLKFHVHYICNLHGDLQQRCCSLGVTYFGWTSLRLSLHSCGRKTQPQSIKSATQILQTAFSGCPAVETATIL